MVLPIVFIGVEFVEILKTDKRMEEITLIFG